MPITYTPLPDSVDYGKQGVAVPGTKQPGQTSHYRNAIYGFLDPNAMIFPKTLQDIFNSGYSSNPDANLLGHRPLLSKSPPKFGPYVWQTYRQVDARRRRIGSALHRLFSTGELKATDMETVGIWAQNRPEWQLVELALHAYGKVGVSLYDTLGRESVEYIINHAQLPIIFTTPDHIATILKLAAGIPSVKVIVSFDPLGDDAKGLLSSWGETIGVRITELSEIERYGEENLIEPLPVSPDQIASLCYTSGTTNLPKGATITHMNLASAAYTNTLGVNFPKGCCLLSYLPLAHISECAANLRIGDDRHGLCIGYFTGDPLRLMDDAQALKPQFFPSVPRLLNRIYQAAMSAGNVPGVKGVIFRTALQTKLDQLHKTGLNTHVIWDALVFRKIRAVLGGNITLIVTGSAPISAEVVDFLEIAFGCDVTEGTTSVLYPPSFTDFRPGYGMTESCGVCTRTLRGDPTSSGTIGPPQPILEIKLVDIPAMNYLSSDKPNPRGGYVSAAPTASWGITKAHEKNTQETLRDGWIHTGDVAEADGSGRFRIIDRVKNIMKLAQGEYVGLEKVENAYAACPIVQQIYVHGDSLQPYLLAVVVPDPLVLAPLASAVLGKKVEPSDIPALNDAVKNPRVVQDALSLLNTEARKSGLVGFEFVKRIHVTMDPFVVEESTLTPTLKLRRKDAYTKFKRELDALYALGEAANGLSKL